MEDNGQYILSSLDNALSILNLFFEHAELSAGEAGKMIGISRTAAFRILATLEAKGYVTRSGTAGYRLGIKVFSLGQLAQRRMVLADLIHPHLAELAEKTGETSHLAVMDGPYHSVFVDKALGHRYLKMDTMLGERRWAHLTGTGKSMLAWKDDDFFREYASSADLSPLTETSLSSLDALIEEMHKIRSQGWAMDKEESEPGLTCYAMPILDAGAQPIAAISCSGPTTRMVAAEARILYLLRSTVGKIQKTTRN